MLGCVTPALVALLAALGVSGSMGWLDYILLPAMALFAALTGYAIFCRLRRRQVLVDR
jgi:mercuric ion transport protein